MRIPNHVGIIPDGNRRWAEKLGFAKEAGYAKGLEPGLQLYRLCQEVGIKEVTYYGFTQDNTKRPPAQRKAFTQACIDAVKMLQAENAELLVIGNTDSPMFPRELLPYTESRINLGGEALR
jgi:undecaprenyl diphosphate synthase